MASALAVIGHNQPGITIPALLLAYTDAEFVSRYSQFACWRTGGIRRKFPLMVPMLVAESRLPAKQSYDTYSEINLAIAAKTIAGEASQCALTFV